MTDPTMSSEYERYVNSDFITHLYPKEFVTFDVLGFWKENETMFPVLSRMAMDIISVQASSIAYESAFSTSGRVLSIRRTRLTPASLEMCMYFEEDVFDDEVQRNEAIPLSDEEIVLDASSKGTLSSGGPRLSDVVATFLKAATDVRVKFDIFNNARARSLVYVGVVRTPLSIPRSTISTFRGASLGQIVWLEVPMIYFSSVKISAFFLKLVDDDIYKDQGVLNAFSVVEKNSFVNPYPEIGKTKETPPPQTETTPPQTHEEETTPQRSPAKSNESTETAFRESSETEENDEENETEENDGEENDEENETEKNDGEENDAEDNEAEDNETTKENTAYKNIAKKRKKAEIESPGRTNKSLDAKKLTN
ncbi:zinc finger BED domain-containing protein RICESLEEPER 2 [Tanacetum coccineum]